jgi:drug/metabolite transporter (DMT)-like permease
VSSILVLAVLLCINGFRIHFTPFSILMGGLLASVTVAANLLSIKAMAVGNVSVYTLFLMLGGMIVPFFVGVFFLQEEPKLLHFIASALFIAALVLPTLEPAEKTNNKARGLFFVLCILLFFLNGANGTVGKIHQIYPELAVGTVDFLLIDYLFETGISLVLFLGCRNNDKFRCAVKKETLISAFGFGIVHIVATFLQLICAYTVNASLMFPFITGATLIFAPLLSRVLFKEKIGKYTAWCIALSVAAGVLFVF